MTISADSLQPKASSLASELPLHAQPKAGAGSAAQADGILSTMPRLPTLSEWHLPGATLPEVHQPEHTTSGMPDRDATAQHSHASSASPEPAADGHCAHSVQSTPQGTCSLRGSPRSPSPDLARQPERVLIVKGHPARLASQSEQFANELTQHLGICAPTCRILRKLVRGALAPLFTKSPAAFRPG